MKASIVFIRKVPELGVAAFMYTNKAKSTIRLYVLLQSFEMDRNGIIRLSV